MDGRNELRVNICFTDERGFGEAAQLFVGTHENEWNAVSACHEFHHGLRTRQARHHDVAYDDIRMQRSCGVHEIGSVGGDPYDIEFCGQNADQKVAYVDIVIGDENS
jgi:hypothetical protein